MKKKFSHILSSSLTLKFANRGKKNELTDFVLEYDRVVKKFTAKFWGLILSGEKVPMMPSGEIAKVDSWLSARAIQCAAKQASGIANGAAAKNSRREWQAQQFDKAGLHKKARVLRSIIAKNSVGCPKPDRIEAQLDARFFSLERAKSGGFDMWVTLKSLGSKDGKRGNKIVIPLRLHKHFNKLAKQGRLINSIRLSENSLVVAFENETPPPKTVGSSIGIDIGQTSIFSMSNGVQIKEGNHGWTLKAINDKMARRKRGSKGFSRAEKHRANFVGESINNLNFDGVSTIRLERIKNLKHGRRTSKSLSHWSATTLLGALKQKAHSLGVQVKEVNPMFTSQRCSCCGWVQKSNRKGERFVCKKCLTALNADLNGSSNIALDLPSLPKAAREQGWNRRGFFWMLDGFIPPTDELIVRQAQKPSGVCAPQIPQ
jgi:putative transposase